MNPEHKHHFNKCVECGKEPDLTYTPLTSEITLSCPGQCARLCITCIGLELAEQLWNTANPDGMIEEIKREADRQFDLYNLGREIDILRDRVNAADSVAAVASMDNDSTYDVDAFHYINSALSQIRAGLDWIETEVKK